jgi:hypothetical protein
VFISNVDQDDSSNVHPSKQSVPFVMALKSNAGNDDKEVQPFHVELRLDTPLVSIKGNEVREEQPCHVNCI